MNALDDILHVGDEGNSVVDMSDIYDLIPDAKFELAALRAELAQLRADLQAAREVNNDAQQLLQWAEQRALSHAERIAALEAAVSEARGVISAYRALPLGPAGYCSYPMTEQHAAADAWLAAHPAPLNRSDQ